MIRPEHPSCFSPTTPKTTHQHRQTPRRASRRAREPRGIRRSRWALSVCGNTFRVSSQHRHTNPRVLKGPFFREQEAASFFSIARIPTSDGRVDGAPAPDDRIDCIPLSLPNTPRRMRTASRESYTKGQLGSVGLYGGRRALLLHPGVMKPELPLRAEEIRIWRGIWSKETRF